MADDTLNYIVKVCDTASLESDCPKITSGEVRGVFFVFQRVTY